MCGNKKRITATNLLGVVLITLLASPPPTLKAQTPSPDQALAFTPNFNGREIAANERLELALNRNLLPGEGRFAVFVNETDVTAMLENEALSLRYTPQFLPFSPGESKLTVYLIAPGENWKTIGEFPFQVRDSVQPDAPKTVNNDSSGIPKGGNPKWFEFTPNVSLNVKGQSQTLTFPREAEPERNPFGEVDGQANIQVKVSNRGWTLNNRFDFVGVGFLKNALRFGELQNEAPKIDLSSYLVELTNGRFAARLGHVSFGSNRHLINGFSSRGITVTVPVGRQNDVTVLAANGTSIVGYDNFIGVTRRKHSVVGAAFAREFFKERPGGLRFEFSVMRGSLLPLTNFNQREVNDAEKSLGFSFKVSGSDTRQRLRYEAGFTRSRFTNPRDPQLEQGLAVTPVRETTRNARHAEISFDLIQGMKLWQEKKLKVTGTYRHEEIEPLFRSIATSTQADRSNNQFEVSASFGEMNFVYGNLRDRDNLAEIASILLSRTHRANALFNIALNSFFTPTKPKKWLPQVSYTYDHVHNFGVALPNGGLFNSLSQVPDQDSFVHGFNAQWQFSDRFRAGYKLGRVFQNNKQPGRERADFRSEVRAATFGTSPLKSIDLTFDLSHESQTNLEQAKTDNTFRFGSSIVWRMPLKNAVLNTNLATTLAGDTKNAGDTRSVEFDIQWSYRFNLGSKKYKKLETQFFIRYSNRYGDVRDRLLFANNFTKTQAFNAGLTFNAL